MDECNRKNSIINKELRIWVFFGSCLVFYCYLICCASALGAALKCWNDLECGFPNVICFPMVPAHVYLSGVAPASKLCCHVGLR